MTERPVQDPPVADSPMWLSHHWPSEYDRCSVVGGRRVCRRCLVLYPVSLVVAVAIGIGVPWPEDLDPWLLWLLPLPAVVDFVAEQLGLAAHAPRRQVVLTALLAVACGRLYVRYLDEPSDSLVWSVTATYLGVCFLAWVLRTFIRSR